MRLCFFTTLNSLVFTLYFWIGEADAACHRSGRVPCSHVDFPRPCCESCRRKQKDAYPTATGRPWKSPMSYFQSLRVERAVPLLKTSNASVEEIAAKVGYKDGGTLDSFSDGGSISE
jgi:hypothetical protein